MASQCLLPEVITTIRYLRETLSRDRAHSERRAAALTLEPSPLGKLESAAGPAQGPSAAWGASWPGPGLPGPRPSPQPSSPAAVPQPSVPRPGPQRSAPDPGPPAPALIRAPRRPARTSPPPDGPLPFPQQDVRLALSGAQAEEPPPRLLLRRLLAFPGLLHRIHI